MTAAPYTIRRAEPEDLAGVVACLTAAFEPYRSQYSRGGYDDTVLTIEAGVRRSLEMTILVASDTSGRIVGTIGCQVAKKGEGHLRGMAVLPEFQGTGVADALLTSAEAKLRAMKCSRVTLDTTKPLERAVRFYVRHGYVPTGAVTNFFGMSLYEYEKHI
jgi:ribosomal protein S18 acetylase RimI-like enzyme